MVPTAAKNLAVENPPWLADWDHEKNVITPSDVTPRSSTHPVWWTCAIDPHHSYTATPAQKAASYEAKARSRNAKPGNGCPYCASKKIDASNSLLSLRPDLAAEWDSARNRKGPAQVAAKSDYRAHWICAVDPTHRWQAVVSSRAAGVGCPYCAGKRATNRNRFTMLAPAWVVAEWHPTKNSDHDPREMTISSIRRVWWQCQRCSHEWQTSISNRHKGDGGYTGCPMCAPVIRSKHEIQLACEFAHLFPDEIDPVHATVVDIGEKRPASVDILFTQARIVIEYDGYIHQSARHASRDRDKTHRLQERGYRVLRIRANQLPDLGYGIDAVSEAPDRSIKATVDAALGRLVALGWIDAAPVRAYVMTSHPLAALRADSIYDGLPAQQKFVPPAVRVARKRRAQGDQPTLF